MFVRARNWARTTAEYVWFDKWYERYLLIIINSIVYATVVSLCVWNAVRFPPQHPWNPAEPDPAITGHQMRPTDQRRQCRIYYSYLLFVRYTYVSNDYCIIIGELNNDEHCATTISGAIANGNFSVLFLLAFDIVGLAFKLAAGLDT